MPSKTEMKVRKQGFFAMLKESIVKSNEGCGPGCGCHAADDKKPASGTAAAKPARKV